MSKKIIKITREGVRESISGNSAELPSSVEFRFQEAAVVDSVLDVAQGTTGTVGGHSCVFANAVAAPCVVTLPSDPTDGQRVTIMAVGEMAVGVSASHAHNAGTLLGVGVTPTNSGSSGGLTFTRDFLYHSGSSIGARWWSSDGITSGISGTYAF